MPHDEEADIVTDIRNRHREWFLDDSLIDPECSRQWLQTCDEANVLFAISTIRGNSIIGTIGWVDIDKTMSVEVGRIVVDYRLALDAGIPARDCPQIAFQAGVRAGDFVICDRGRDAIYTRNKKTALSASRLARRRGMLPVDDVAHLPPDWHAHDLCVWRNTRDEWLRWSHV